MDLTAEQYREYCRSGQLPVERRRGYQPPPPVWTPREDAPPGPVVLELPMPPKILRPNSKGSNWQYKAAAKTKARQEAGIVARINRPRMPYANATLAHTWYIRNFADQDNLIGWLKAYIDGLADGGVIENDRGLTVLPPEQVIDRKNPRVVLTITPQEPSSDRYDSPLTQGN